MMGDPLPLGARREHIAEIAHKIKDLIYEEAGRMSLAEAIGILELVKVQIIQDEVPK